MRLPATDRKVLLDAYSSSFYKHGYHSSSVLWDLESKQDIRYEVLTSLYDFDHKSVLDIGCGFGDLNRVLKRKDAIYEYVGIDINPDLLSAGREIYKEQNVHFVLGDFLEYEFERTFDYIVASGTFNFRLMEMDQYEYIDTILQKAFTLCRDGFAFNFLSDRVNFQGERLFNYNPERLLTMAYKLTRNVTLRSDYMPFDFSLFVFKDDSYNEDRVFNRYLNKG